MASVIDLAHACASVYQTGLTAEAERCWEARQTFGSPSSDFYALLVRHRTSEQYALAVRGTDDFNDLDDDLSIWVGLVPRQLTQVRRAINTALTLRVFTRDQLFLTGHSLGGALRV